MRRTLPLRGGIVFHPDLKCPHCHSKGVFVGKELEYGAFYECAWAKYCPTCRKTFDVLEGDNFAPFDQERFLPIMKKKLIELICKSSEKGLFRIIPCTVLSLKGPCPQCGADAYTFYKDLGGVDHYHNYWSVCINPLCTWSQHYESYEPGPYV